MNDRTGNRYINTSLRNSGRVAGTGISYDDYSETSGVKDYEKKSPVRFPHDGISPEALNGPVICYKNGSKEKQTVKEETHGKE